MYISTNVKLQEILDKFKNVIILAYPDRISFMRDPEYLKQFIIRGLNASDREMLRNRIILREKEPTPEKAALIPREEEIKKSCKNIMKKVGRIYEKLANDLYGKEDSKCSQLVCCYCDEASTIKAECGHVVCLKCYAKNVHSNDGHYFQCIICQKREQVVDSDSEFAPVVNDSGIENFYQREDVKELSQEFYNPKYDYSTMPLRHPFR